MLQRLGPTPKAFLDFFHPQLPKGEAEFSRAMEAIASCWWWWLFHRQDPQRRIVGANQNAQATQHVPPA